MAVDCGDRCRAYGPWLPIAIAMLQLILVWWHRDPALINPDAAQLSAAGVTCADAIFDRR